MKLQALASIIAIGVAPSIWANDGDNAKGSGDNQTRMGVAALANRPKADLKPDAKPSVGALANVRSQSEQPDSTYDAQSNVPAHARASRQATARPDIAQDGLRQNSTGRAANHSRQFGAVSRPYSAYQWGGFVPPNQWGFMPNGVYSNRVSGYRPFGFPSSFASGGFGFGYGDPYLVPNYYGYGFSPIVFGLSGPVVVRYDDPIGRQWKFMEAGLMGKRIDATNP